MLKTKQPRDTTAGYLVNDVRDEDSRFLYMDEVLVKKFNKLTNKDKYRILRIIDEWIADEKKFPSEKFYKTATADHEEAMRRHIQENPHLLILREENVKRLVRQKEQQKEQMK